MHLQHVGISCSVNTRTPNGSAYIGEKFKTVGFCSYAESMNMQS